MSIKVFRVSYYGCGNDLVNIIIYNFKFFKLFDFVRNVIELIEINGQWSFIDDVLYVGYSKVVVIVVVKFRIYYFIFVKAENLFVN